jgi:hypothetical protein
LPGCFAGDWKDFLSIFPGQITGGSAWAEHDKRMSAQEGYSAFAGLYDGWCATPVARPLTTNSLLEEWLASRGLCVLPWPMLLGPVSINRPLIEYSCLTCNLI